MPGGYRLIAFLILAPLGAVVLFSPDLARTVAGFKPFGEVDPGKIDEPASVDDRDAPRFLAERNRVEVEVPREMTLQELLRLYQIDFPHVRRQIAEQEGAESLADDTVLAAGRRYVVPPPPPAEEPP